MSCCCTAIFSTGVPRSITKKLFPNVVESVTVIELMAIVIPFSTERSRIRGVLRRLINGSDSKLIDQETSDQLTKVYGNLCGFTNGTFRDSLRDQPIVTLLELLLCPEAGLIALASDVTPPIVLEAISSFAVLGSAGVANTGTSIINGNLGISPGTLTGFPPGVVNGTIHNNDISAITAHVAAFAFYLLSLTFTGGTPIAADISGQTLTAGFYTATSDLSITSADLTLSGNPFDLFLFRVPGNLNLAAGKDIVVSGGATADNVVWVVGGDVTIGVDSGANGTFLGIGDQTLDEHATLDGRLISHSGVITLFDNVVIVPPAP